MTAVVTNHVSPLGSSTEAGWRQIVREYSMLLAGVGLIQTSDTGQIDVETVPYPVLGTYAGYQMWRFNDALQASAPIFIRIDFGRTGNSSNFAFSLRVGTGSNGAGTLTGVVSETFSNSLTTTGSPQSSYACHTDGFLGIAHRHLATSSVGYVIPGSFIVCRTCDANGYPTADGAYVLAPLTDKPSAQVLKFTDGGMVVNPSSSQDIFQFPLGVAQTVYGEMPMHPIWMPLPQLVPVFGIAAHPAALVVGADFIDIAMVGSRVRRYIVGQRLFGGSGAKVGYAMLFE